MKSAFGDETPKSWQRWKKAAKIGNIFPMQCSLTGFPARQTPGEAISEACAAVYVVPAQAFRSCFEATNRYVKGDVPVINCAKGVERGTHMLELSQIAAQIRPDVRYAVLSGPSHAEELAKALPTMLTAAAPKRKKRLSLSRISL